MAPGSLFLEPVKWFEFVIYNQSIKGLIVFLCEGGEYA